MPELNEAQKADCTSRIEKFKKSYEALVQQLQVEIMTVPTFQHANNSGLFGVVVMADFVDLKYRNPSPLHAQKN